MIAQRCWNQRKCIRLLLDIIGRRRSHNRIWGEERRRYCADCQMETEFLALTLKNEMENEVSDELRGEWELT